MSSTTERHVNLSVRPAQEYDRNTKELKLNDLPAEVLSRIAAEVSRAPREKQAKLRFQVCCNEEEYYTLSNTRATCKVFRDACRAAVAGLTAVVIGPNSFTRRNPNNHITKRVLSYEAVVALPFLVSIRAVQLESDIPHSDLQAPSGYCSFSEYSRSEDSGQNSETAVGSVGSDSPIDLESDADQNLRTKSTRRKRGQKTLVSLLDGIRPLKCVTFERPYAHRKRIEYQCLAAKHAETLRELTVDCSDAKSSGQVLWSLSSSLQQLRLIRFRPRDCERMPLNPSAADNLQALFLDGCKDMGGLFRQLKSCKFLTYLSLVKCSLGTEFRLLQDIPNLTALVLVDSIPVTVWKVLRENPFPKLQRFSVVLSHDRSIRECVALSRTLYGNLRRFDIGMCIGSNTELKERLIYMSKLELHPDCKANLIGLFCTRNVSGIADNVSPLKGLDVVYCSLSGPGDGVESCRLKLKNLGSQRNLSKIRELRESNSNEITSFARTASHLAQLHTQYNSRWGMEMGQRVVERFWSDNLNEEDLRNFNSPL
eukprot:Plantae.Rhodophyta-Hildenbrandia_rubra.ctg7684.p1 GENE.Plantae.Rhodophyta-Hildenbrandia_rubra.ctg7684~~Plantae.Rhodophyta-Hildenbrandia_rubra.ctg7684.p1  ORF type:complete len:539 (-),score=49.88 Plantae.Rhodophyta-Hildenbrandia_rubra.ctg7684:956-2572(-)